MAAVEPWSGWAAGWPPVLTPCPPGDGVGRFLCMGLAWEGKGLTELRLLFTPKGAGGRFRTCLGSWAGEGLGPRL